MLRQKSTRPKPFILLAGERRSYNANQIYREPEWREIDPHGALRIHLEDTAELGWRKAAMRFVVTILGVFQSR